MSNVVEIVVKGTDKSGGTTLKTTEKNYDKLGASTTKARDSLGRYSKTSTQAQEKTKGLGQTTQAASGKLKLMAAAGGLLAVKLGKDAVGAASDLNESTNAVTQVFGPFSKSMDAASKNAYKAGLSQRQFNEAITPLGALLKNSGLPMKEVADRTLALTKRAEDMASVFNTSVPDALDAIKAGLRGESDPLEKYGVSLTQAKIQAEAMAETHKKVAKDITATEMATARMNLIMKQTKDTQGDFARTSGGLANQQRILSAEWENAQAKLGSMLLPALSKLATLMTTKVIPAVQDVTDWMGNHKKEVVEFGIAVVGVLTAVGTYKVIDKMKTSIQGLNVAMKANPFLAIVAGLIALVTWFVITYKRSEDFRNKVHGVIDNLSHAWDNSTHAMDNVKHAWDNVWHAGKNVVEFFKNAYLDLKIAALHIAIAFTQYLEIPVLNVFSAIVHGAASAFGWVPGLGGKLKKARGAFDEFRRGVDKDLSRMRADLSTTQAQRNANTLTDRIKRLRAALLSLPTSVGAGVNASGQITIAGGGRYGTGGITGAATGGARGGAVMTDEYGPEIKRYPDGTMVYPAGQSAGMVAGWGGNQAPIVLELRSSGSAVDNFLLELLRKAIRVRGGDVQIVLGRS